MPEDGTIYGPLGGRTAFGGSAFGELQREGCRKLWLSGNGDIELLAAGTSADLAWLIYIERAMVRFVGHEDVRRWELRITDLFRREGDRCVRFHIHEDACVDPRGLDAILAGLP